MLSGTYTGPIRHFQGKRALLRDDTLGEPHQMLAQFDDTRALNTAGERLGYGWHRFARNDFAIDK